MASAQRVNVSIIGTGKYCILCSHRSAGEFMTDGVLPVECTVARTNCIHRAIVFGGNEYHRVCIGWSIAAYQGSVMRSKEDEKAGDQRTDYENGGDGACQAHQALWRRGRYRHQGC